MVFLVIFLIIGGIWYINREDLLRDDYYQAINQEVLMEEKIKEGEYTWSTFTEAQEESDLVIDEIVDEVMADQEIEIDVDTRHNMQVVWKNAVDMEIRNQVGIEPLKEYLNTVFQCSNIKDLVEVIIGIENDLGVDILTSMGVEADYQNNQEMIVYFYPLVFPFGTSVDYFVDPDYMTYKAYLKRAMVQIYQLYGYDKITSRKLASEQVSVYEKIGEYSQLADSYVDIGSYYRVIFRDEFGDQFVNWDMQNYLEDRGIGQEKYYSVVDLGQYQFIDSLLTDEYLEFWKNFILLRVLGDYASYADSNYVEVIEKLNQALLGKEESTDTIEKHASEMVVSLFQREFDQMYQKKVLTEEKTIYIENMVEEIRSSFLRMLDSNEWLSSQTKELAKEKVQKMKLVIGLDQEISFLGSEYHCVSGAEGGNLLENVMSIQKIYRLDSLKRLENNTRDQGISQHTVNAYYSPLDNSIHIPASVVFLFDEEDNDYENLGAIGMVIAHEMTHGFDSNGSQFDEEGNMVNWWLDEDRETYEKLKKEVENYYSGFEVLEGKHIDGKATVNENIADLGAIACLVQVAEERGASQKEYQQMFSSFAKFWVSQSKEEYMELLLLEDSHAPNQYRVNAVLSSTDKFYEVYDVYFWNDMYVSGKDRVGVW